MLETITLCADSEPALESEEEQEEEEEGEGEEEEDPLDWSV